MAYGMGSFGGGVPNQVNSYLRHLSGVLATGSHQSRHMPGNNHPPLTPTPILQPAPTQFGRGPAPIQTDIGA